MLIIGITKGNKLTVDYKAAKAVLLAQVGSIVLLHLSTTIDTVL